MKKLAALGMTSLSYSKQAPYIKSLVSRLGKGYTQDIVDHSKPCVNVHLSADWRAKLKALGWFPTDINAGYIESLQAEVWIRQDSTWPLVILPERKLRKTTTPTTITLCAVDAWFAAKDAKRIAKLVSAFGVVCQPEHAQFSKSLHRPYFTMPCKKLNLAKLATALKSRYDDSYIRLSAQDLCLILLSDKLNIDFTANEVKVTFRDF